jgi:dsRNA-specific ribonuclease
MKEIDTEKEKTGKVDESKKLLTEEEKQKNVKELDVDNELESEIKPDKISIEVKYDNNKEASEIVSKLDVDKKKIDEIVENQIKIIPSQTYRFIYTKTLADIVESLTAFTYLSALDNFGEQKYDEAFNLATDYLNDMKVLNKTYKNIINEITQVAVDNVKVNDKCKFNEEKRDKHLELVIKNKYYTFKNKKLAYQAMTHPSTLAEENLQKEINYVNKSYQRLAFLGEAIVELFVSIFVYKNNPYETESNLHKMRICGINHHIISLIACDLKFHDCLLSPSGGGFRTDIKKYSDKLMLERGKLENKYKLPLEELDNEEFVIILCELFHAYLGAIFVDSHDIKTTFKVLEEIMQNYLINNATKDTFTEHPKEIILNEYMKRRHFIKSLKENGGNRIILKYEKENNTAYRKRKMYTYQLIINGFIIYKENIVYSRPTIKKAQEKAKIIFLRVCDEIDRRMKLKMNEQNNHFDIKNILDYLGIIYEEAY